MNPYLFMSLIFYCKITLCLFGLLETYSVRQFCLYLEISSITEAQLEQKKNEIF